MIWTFILKNILNLKTIGVLVLIGFGIYIGRSCEKKSKQKAVNQVEKEKTKIIQVATKQYKEDSTTIVRYIYLSDSLKNALTQKENIRLQYEVLNKSYVAQIKDFKGKIILEENKVKEAIEKGFVICDTLILERKQKLLSNKYYYVIIEKPKNLKELIRD